MNSNWHFNSHPLHKHTVDAHRRWVTVVYQEHNWEYSVTYARARARACVVTCKTRMFIFCFSNSAAAAEQTLCSNGIRKQGACKPIELCKAWLCLSLCGCVCCGYVHRKVWASVCVLQHAWLLCNAESEIGFTATDCHRLILCNIL